MEQRLQFGQKVILFTVQYAERRSLGLQVHPDSTVHAIAPLDTPMSDIFRKVKTKAGWILKQQEHFASFLPLTPPRRYLNGETHLYLGRQYKLRQVASQENRVRLYRGQMEVHVPLDTPEAVEEALRLWYKEKARAVFEGLLADILYKTPRFREKKWTLHVKTMQTRWGSCSPAGRITLNTELIKAPKACIEYVILHELCHLDYPSHNKKFYRLLASLMPDWERWKERLERTMA